MNDANKEHTADSNCLESAGESKAEGRQAGEYGERGRCCGHGHHGSHHEHHGHCHRHGTLLEPAVLIALAGAESHGYELVREVEKITGGRVVPDSAGLYRVLRRLEEIGALESWWEEAGGGPQRRSYRLTPDGKELLVHWIDHLKSRRSALDELISTAEKTPL